MQDGSAGEVLADRPPLVRSRRAPPVSSVSRRLARRASIEGGTARSRRAAPRPRSGRRAAARRTGRFPRRLRRSEPGALRELRLSLDQLRDERPRSPPRENGAKLDRLRRCDRPQPGRVPRAGSGRARQSTSTGASEIQLSEYSTRSSSVGSAQCTSSRTTTSGRSPRERLEQAPDCPEDLAGRAAALRLSGQLGQALGDQFRLLVSGQSGRSSPAAASEPPGERSRRAAGRSLLRRTRRSGRRRTVASSPSRRSELRDEAALAHCPRRREPSARGSASLLVSARKRAEAGRAPPAGRRMRHAPAVGAPRCRRVATSLCARSVARASRPARPAPPAPSLRPRARGGALSAEQDLRRQRRLMQLHRDVDGASRRERLSGGGDRRDHLARVDRRSGSGSPGRALARGRRSTP